MEIRSNHNQVSKKFELNNVEKKMIVASLAALFHAPKLAITYRLGNMGAELKKIWAHDIFLISCNISYRLLISVVTQVQVRVRTHRKYSCFSSPEN